MITKHKKGLYLITAIVSLPQITSAAVFGCATSGTGCTFKEVVPEFITAILKPVVPFIVGMTVVYFLWGVVSYIKNAESADAREEGKQKMFYGIIALAVMLSFWGFALVLKATFFG
jgi:hypothetical protein